MDKTLIFALATAFTASLFAETTTYISGTGFEPLDAGADVLNSSDMKTGDASHSYSSLWKFASTGDRSTSLTITTYSDAAKSTVAVPDPDDAANYPKYRTSSGDNEKYLRVDSGSDVLSRYVGPYTGDEDVVDISDNGGIYMDTMVQFTATDTPPTPAAADKLLVWLYAPPEDPSSTNLMVTAGSYADGRYSSIATTNTIPVSCVEILEREWHRLTIVAEMFSYGALSSTARFKVYIDGTQLVASDGTSKFPSLVPYNSTNFGKLQTLNFNGDGAVDDVVFGAGNPFPPESLAYTIALGEGVTGFSYSVDGVDKGKADIGEGERKFVFTDVNSIGKEFAITAVTYADGYQADSKSTLSGIITEDGSFTITACKTGFTVVVDGGDPVACASLAEVDISEASSATITMNSDYTLASGETLTITTSVVLDLNGHVLQSATIANMITVARNKSLVVKDSVGTGVIKFSDGIDPEKSADEIGYLINNNGGTLTIGENVTDTFVLDNGRIRTRRGTLKINGGRLAKVPHNDSVEITDFTGICPSGYTLAKADGDEYYTLQEAKEEETTEVSADDVAATQYDTKEAANAAAAGVTIVAPNNASLSKDEKTAYTNYVTTAVVESDGKFVVNAVFTAEKEGELQEVADEAAAAALAASADGKIEVSAVPGLYYALDHGSALPLEESEPTLAPSGAEKVEFTVEKDAEQGFYRVRISPTNKKRP